MYPSRPSTPFEEGGGVVRPEGKGGSRRRSGRDLPWVLWFQSEREAVRPSRKMARIGGHDP